MTKQNTNPTNIEEFSNEVLTKFTEEMTDQIFLYIENDKDLMRKYLHLVANTGNLGNLNMNIAKKIKAYFDLTSEDEQKITKSSLIESYTKFSK